MASVAEIDGLTVPTGAPAVPSPAAAYSVRLLDSAVGVPTYTGAAMRIRRVTGTGNTGNDDEADVAFDTSLTEPTISLDSAVSNFSAGGSNATTLGQFLNVGTVGGTTYTDADSLAPNTAAAYVDEWKDQSGNANHATQGTPSNQPQIHSGLASTDLILENGKPAIASTISTSLTMSSTISVRSLFSAQKSTLGFLMGYSSGAPYHANGIFYLSAAFADSAVLNGNNYENSTLKNFTNVTRSTSQVVVSMIHTGTVSANQISQDRNTSNSSLSGTRQELILWSDDQSDDRTAIETNISDYYTIIINPDAATSGFLFDYSNATTAYSVRQLNNNAEYCMQVQRSDGERLYVGFVAGDLDTQAIIDFGGALEVGIYRWFDQSGNQNHATLFDLNDPPQIYDGSSIISLNGNPAIYAPATGTRMAVPSQTLTDASVLCVYELSTGSYPINNEAAPRYRLRFFSGRMYLYLDGATISGSLASAGDHQLHTFYDDGATIYWRTNGGDEYTRAFTGSTKHERIIGNLSSGMKFQEYILFDTNKYSDRSGIESDAMTYFNIP